MMWPSREMTDVGPTFIPRGWYTFSIGKWLRHHVVIPEVSPVEHSLFSHTYLHGLYNDDLQNRVDFQDRLAIRSAWYGSATGIYGMTSEVVRPSHVLCSKRGNDTDCLFVKIVLPLHCLGAWWWTFRINSKSRIGRIRVPFSRSYLAYKRNSLRLQYSKKIKICNYNVKVQDPV